MKKWKNFQTFRDFPRILFYFLSVYSNLLYIEMTMSVLDPLGPEITMQLRARCFCSGISELADS